MKKFIQIYGIVLVAVEVFLFFGGYMLFDFSRRYYLAGASVAFVLAVLLFVFMAQSEKIEALEARVQALERRDGKAE